MNLSDTKTLLKTYGLKPNKLLGQNFLICENILANIIEAAELIPDDIVLEIGPGLGVLTIELARKVKTVIAVEKDIKMFALLKDVLKNEKIDNVEIANEDGLNYSPPSTPYKLIANLPYYITNPIIMKFLEAETQPACNAVATAGRPELMVLMVQKEVAQRICSNPPKMNKLAVFCQFYSQPKIIDYVPKTCFWPSPKVDSAIIKLTPTETTEGPSFRVSFSKIVNAGFSQPRKQLLNNLSKELNLSREQTAQWLACVDIKPTQRAETLSIDNWIRLATKFDRNF